MKIHIILLCFYEVYQSIIKEYHVMRIEELINENNFNIFTNPQIEESNIKYLAKGNYSGHPMRK